MSEQAQPLRGNRQQPVNQEGEAPAPAPPGFRNSSNVPHAQPRRGATRFKPWSTTGAKPRGPSSPANAGTATPPDIAPWTAPSRAVATSLIARNSVVGSLLHALSAKFAAIACGQLVVVPPRRRPSMVALSPSSRGVNPWLCCRRRYAFSCLRFLTIRLISHCAAHPLLLEGPKRGECGGSTARNRARPKWAPPEPTGSGRVLEG